MKLLKSFSQNFLIDQNIAKKIVSAANVQKADCILEIGPGGGALTKVLLSTGATVIAIEKDERFANLLSHARLTVIHDDFLKYHLKPTDKKIKVVANIPYQITAPILDKLLSNYWLFDTITLMMQDEVARRITAKPGTKAYSRLSVLCQYYSTPRYLFSVASTCFIPRPKVKSAVVQLIPKSEVMGNDKEFFSFIKLAFQTRRKTLINCLKESYDPDRVSKALHSIGKKKTTRAEEISLTEFQHLFKQIDDSNN